MKKALLSLVCALSFFVGKAQWVNLPDTNFGKWLVQNYPSNYVYGNPQAGYFMDTISIIDTFLPYTTLNLSNKNLTDVYGIEFMRWDDSLCHGCQQRTLNLSNNKLKRMPISIGYDNITLNLSGNQIDTAIFSYEYINLKNIDLSNNHLKCVINLVTGSYSYLYDLNFNDNDLTSLPGFGTANDNQLHVRRNHFTSIPLISYRTNYIDCGENLITSITNIPYKLVTLICDHNLLTSLNLQLGSPNFFRNIDCSFNNVTTITNIPVNFWSLKCNDNPNLSCISSKISNLQSLYIGNTQIHCLPNRFSCTTFDINPSVLPLCGPSSGCYYTFNTLGNVHIDTSANCILDSLNRGNGIKNAKVLLRKNGNVVNQTYTYNALGDYIILIDSLGSHTISIDTLKFPFNVKCPTTQERNINFTFADTIIYNQDFGLECKGVDLASFSVNVNPGCRPGRQSSVVISAGDIVKQFFNTSCSNNVSGNYTTILNGPAHYASPGNGALTPIVSGNILTYVISDFSILSDAAFNINVNVDSTALIGDQICLTSIVHSATDINPSNDTLSSCFNIFNSFDPNIKEVSPRTLTPEGGWLTYTIHFQNTGNDTAYNIFLRDTLSNNLQIETFQFLASSHQAEISVSQNNALFVFPYINLVDSATNPEGSQGWIQFKIKTKPNLVLNTQINNRAAIYFDLNPAIFTNVATTTVQAPPCQNSSFTLYDSICQGSVKVFNGINLTTAGNYNDTLVNSSGCDSIITLHLFVKQKSTAQLYDSICQSSVKVFNGSNLTATGNYNDTLINSAGCDSIITLHLFVKQKTTAQLYDSICQGNVKVFNGSNLTAAGNYTDTLVNSAGCDSIITLHLFVKQKTTASINDTICQGDSKQFNGVNLTQAGDYYDTLIGKNGCDSVIHLHLVTKPTPATPVVNRNNNTLHTSYTASYAYQWIRNNQTIANATDTSYLLTQNGSYTVKVTAPNSCSSSSIAFSVLNVGINTIEEEAILLFPNPNTGLFNLSIPESLTSCKLSITDVLGRTVLSTIVSQPLESITLTDATSGTYLATFVKDDVKKVLRFVIYK